MATLNQRAQRNTNIWPGFVDALATLLMVIIFLLMIFVLAQFFLGEALIGRNAALQKLETLISSMSNLLSLERKANEDLRQRVSLLSDELQSSVTTRDDLRYSLGLMTSRAKNSQELAESLSTKLKMASSEINKNKETIKINLKNLTKLENDIVALQALRNDFCLLYTSDAADE